MANALYDKGREGFLDGSIDWDTDNIAMVMIDEAVDVPILTTDDNLDDITGGARIGGLSSNFTGKTVTDGVADANDVTFTSVTGASVESGSIFLNSGTESTSRLICNIDTATGLPVTPNGGDISWQWDSGANRIFKL